MDRKKSEKTDKPLTVSDDCIYQQDSTAKWIKTRLRKPERLLLIHLESSHGCLASSLQLSPACASVCEVGKQQPFTSLGEKSIFPQKSALHKLQELLLRLYSTLAWQWYDLQHYIYQTLMNSSSQTLCKAGNHYLPFTDGELRHSKMWVICLEEICSQARNWNQTFQISEHHSQSTQFRSDMLAVFGFAREDFCRINIFFFFNWILPALEQIFP